MSLTLTIKSIYRSLLPMELRRRLWNLRKNQRDARARARDQRHVRLNVACNVCQGRNITPFQNRRVQNLPFNFYVCKDCEFIFVRPTPDPGSYYAEAEMPDFGTGVWNQQYLEAIEAHSAGRGKLLEIGFGNASFLKLAHDAGWEVYGADLNKSLVRHATEVLKLPNIACGTIEEIGYSPDYFDVVAAFNFIEHVPDPRATLQSIHRILRPGGLAIILCPNISGIYHQLIGDIFPDSDPLNLTWVPPDHIGYFNKQNLKLLMESVGFTVLGDQSHRTSDLWWQHELTIGPKVTDLKMRQMLEQIRSSPSPPGETRVIEFREAILKLLLERMSWGMIADLMEIEPALGAENAVLFVARKSAT